MSEKTKEVIVCKFDDEIECAAYNCEEDVSTIEMLDYPCPLREEKEKMADKADALYNELEKLRNAIKQRYAILNEQHICTDCFKDVPVLASLCVDSSRSDSK